MQPAKILILGATGMLGHALFKHFFSKTNYHVFGTVRSLESYASIFSPDERMHLISNVEADDFDSVINAFALTTPDVVINCIGIIKQSQELNNQYRTISLNSLFPHCLANLCAVDKTRLIHLSSDCVFDGKAGNYLESDIPNAIDLYGRTKYLGEVNAPDVLTIRTSIIGHELNSSIALVDWFLSQTTQVNGYTNAIFSGVTTYELANILELYVLPNNLSGLYHISAQAISKFNLLKLIADVYAKKIVLNPFDNIYLNHSLNSDKFRDAVGFKPKSWLQMVQEMHAEFISHVYYSKKLS